eukprot:5863935-Prymnesium_polylepis.1
MPVSESVIVTFAVSVSVGSRLTSRTDPNLVVSGGWDNTVCGTLNWPSRCGTLNSRRKPPALASTMICLARS